MADKFTKLNEKKPREKILKYGGKKLKDSELIAILLGTGYKSKDVFKLADELVMNANGSLDRIANYTAEDFKAILGIKDAKAARLMAAMEIANRVYVERNKIELEKFNSVSKAGRYLQSLIGKNMEEHFMVLILNTKNQHINDLDFLVEYNSYILKKGDRTVEFSLECEDLISKGTLNQTFALPREVFRNAIRLGASTIMLAHNHPSGDLTPSKEDIDTTKRLVDAGAIIGIHVLDHFIVSKDGYYSLKEHGVM